LTFIVLTSLHTKDCSVSKRKPIRFW